MKERIQWIDEAKGIGILLVMFGHCYLHWYFCFWFYSFHMSLFFFLSGYTFSRKERYDGFLKKKIKTLLVPYLFFVIITMLCNGVLAITHGNSYDLLDIAKQYLIQHRYTLLWFITCLFLAEQAMYLLSILNSRYAKNRFWLISFVIALIVFYLYRISINIDLPWNADLTILGTAFMCLGQWCKNSKWITTTYFTKPKILLCLSMCGCLIASSLNYKYFTNVDWYSDRWGNPILFVIAAVSGTVAVISVSMLKNNKILVAIGKNSLMYYGLHRIVIDLMFVVYGKLGIEIINTSWSAVGFALICVLVSVCVIAPLNLFVLKYVPWCLGRKKVKVE